jgi:hypothetical protein
MRVPQVNERVKEAPAQALRAMFAGIGQLMLFTDRLRNRPADEAAKEAEGGKEANEASVPAQAPAPESAAAAAETAAAPEPVKEEVAEAPATAPEETTPAAPAAQAEAPAPAAPAAETPAAELPLPNYDELTVPSLRARMRNLSADQLNELIAYEGAHANRADVIAMFERRIAKLAEG